PREERDHQPLQQLILTDDDLLDLVEHLLHRPLLDRSVHRRDLLVDYFGGPPAAALALAIGTAKPMPANASWLVGLTSAVTMPMPCPARFTSGPPELPGFTAASNWMSPCS